MISTFFARLIRFAFYGPLALHVFVNRQVLRFADWLEDEHPLDHPSPWLCGLLLAVLLWWLVHDAWK